MKYVGFVGWSVILLICVFAAYAAGMAAEAMKRHRDNDKPDGYSEADIEE